MQHRSYDFLVCFLEAVEGGGVGGGGSHEQDVPMAQFDSALTYVLKWLVTH